MLKNSKQIVSSIWDFSASLIIVYGHASLVTDNDLWAIFYIQINWNTENNEVKI